MHKKKNTQVDKGYLKSEFIGWLHFLCSTKESPKNNKILTAFFVQKFSHSPQKFTDFISYIKSYLSKKNSPQKKEIALKYLSILSSLCERFGLYTEKLELDDRCFYITERKSYTQLDKALERYKKDSQKIIHAIFILFEDILIKNRIKAHIKGRYKNLYSIYKKCRSTKIEDVFTLHDIFAFRFITESSSAEECFKIIWILHDMFIPLPTRFKDYISIPKVNGYQSIHTSLTWLIQDFDLMVEVQVRTKHMDDVCEKGVAAHFAYKAFWSNIIGENKEEKLLSHMQNIAENYWETNKVHCMTPHGDIIELVYWQNAYEFARKIHSELPKKAKYVLVNGEMQNLDYILQDLQTVEIKI